MTADQMPNISFNMDTLEDSTGGATANRIQSLPKGISHFRILPPFGAGNGGSLFRQYNLHWGFTGPNGKKRPVSCSYFTEGFCPVCSRVFEVKKEIERLKLAGEEANSEKLEDLNKYVGEHSCKRSFLYNAVAAGGNVVMLNVTKTAHEELKKLLFKAVTEKKFDPTNLTNGVWFEFNKTGSMFQTKYAVDYKKISVEVDGETLEKLDRSPLPDDLVKAISTQLTTGGEGPLHDIHKVYDIMTAQELSSIMNGGPIPNKRQATTTAAVTSATVVKPAAADRSTPVMANETSPAATTTTASKAAPTPASPNVSDIAAEIARLRAMQAQAVGASK